MLCCFKYFWFISIYEFDDLKTHKTRNYIESSYDLRNILNINRHTL